MNSLWQDPEINNFKIFTEAAASVHLLIATALLMTSRTREETLYFLADEWDQIPPVFLFVSLPNQIAQGSITEDINVNMCTK